MFYRKKILLSLIEVFGDRISKMELQKYLFLFTRLQDNAAYDFIPYKYGCYSFTAASDLESMNNRGFLTLKDEAIVKIDSKKYLNQLEFEDQRNLKKFSHKNIIVLMN